MMTDAEIGLLERNLKPGDRVWEWGSGSSTLWLSKRVRSVTSVEHQRTWAEKVLTDLDGSGAADVSILFIPPNGLYVEGGEDDGDFGTFREYCQAFNGRGVDVVILDGRARVAAARWMVECAEFSLTPETRVFLHDVHRKQLDPVWCDDPESGWKSYFSLVERVDNLVLLAPRFDR